jgi:hypothetical protein
MEGDDDEVDNRTEDDDDSEKEEEDELAMRREINTSFFPPSGKPRLRNSCLNSSTLNRFSFET